SATGLQPRQLGAHGISGRAHPRIRGVPEREMMLVRANRTAAITDLRGEPPFRAQTRREKRLPPDVVGAPAHSRESIRAATERLEEPRKRIRPVIEMTVSRIELGQARANHVV